MQKSARVRVAVLAMAIIMSTAALARAQATRTWVSGVGNDADPCSRTAPCKTFAGAFSKTATGGYIDALDSGGFGAITITKSLTLEGNASIAGVLVTLAGKGVIVNSATAIVHLRNLSLESPVSPGINPCADGVDVIPASQVHVERCTISGFTNSAINFHPSNGSLYVSDTTVTSNGNNGIIVATGRATIDTVKITGNTNAIGVLVNGNAIATVKNSSVTGNSTGLAAVTNPAAVLNVETCVIT